MPFEYVCIQSEPRKAVSKVLDRRLVLAVAAILEVVVEARESCGGNLRGRTKKARKNLTEILGALKAIEPESLARTEVLGQDLSFKEGIPVFRRTISLFAELAECNLDNVPAERLGQLHSLAQQALHGFQEIQKFSVANASNPAATRNQLIAQVRDQWHAYYSHVTPEIAYSKGRGTDYSQLEREARGALSQMKDQLAEIRTEKDKGVAEIQGALEQVRRAAAEAGVAQHAIHFRNEASGYEKEARTWMVVGGLFAVATILFAVFGLGSDLAKLGETATTARVIQVIASRLVVLSVLTFGLAWAARNYSASRHNLVVNRHRQNALSTFETFVKAASDVQTKDAVLIQATQSIFCSQPSGFVKADAEAGGSQIVEVVRNMTGTKES
jgi:hypothetical protein